MLLLPWQGEDTKLINEMTYKLGLTLNKNGDPETALKVIDI